MEHLKDIIQQSLENAISYKEYRELIDKLVEEKSTTGLNQSQDLIDFTALNQRRYKRLDKTLKLSENEEYFFSNYSKKIIWLVITEAWCGDAAQIIPMINKIAEINQNIQLKLVLRDENDELMQCFLTNGGKAVPKLLILDASTYEVLDTWGPRPQKATKMVEEYKKEHGKLTPEFKEELQRWYNNDKGRSIVDDLKYSLSTE